MRAHQEALEKTPSNSGDGLLAIRPISPSPFSLPKLSSVLMSPMQVTGSTNPTHSERKKMRTSLILLIISTTIFAGCGSFHPPIETGTISTFGLAPTFEYKSNANANFYLTQYNNAKPEEKENIRNRITFEFMTLIDEDYGAYERKLRGSKAFKDSTVETTSLIITGAASISTGGAPAILAAMDTVLKGSNSSIDKNFLGDRVPELIINKMRANRSLIAGQIFEKLNLPDSNYPLQAAIRDLMRYYGEGSVTSALSALSTDAANDAAKNSEDAHKKQIKITK